MKIYHPVALRDGGTVQSVQISNGNAGIFDSLKVMRQYVREGRTDPRIIEAARGIPLMSGIAQKDNIGELQALFEYVRDRIRYVHDVLDHETISPAWYTLHYRSGDCDDKAVLLASLLEAIEVPTRFCVTGYTGANYEHVTVRAVTIDGDIAMDPTEPHPMGWAGPVPTVMWIEKLPSELTAWDRLTGNFGSKVI